MQWLKKRVTRVLCTFQWPSNYIMNVCTGLNSSWFALGAARFLFSICQVKFSLKNHGA